MRGKKYGVSFSRFSRSSSSNVVSAAALNHVCTCSSSSLMSCSQKDLWEITSFLTWQKSFGTLKKALAKHKISSTGNRKIPPDTFVVIFLVFFPNSGLALLPFSIDLCVCHLAPPSHADANLLSAPPPSWWNGSFFSSPAGITYYVSRSFQFACFFLPVSCHLNSWHPVCETQALKMTQWSNEHNLALLFSRLSFSLSLSLFLIGGNGPCISVHRK